ncbi:17650_t:CDS:2, partial [Gigaspora margarita]
MELKLSNSQTNELSRLKLKAGDSVAIYLCGPTVYDHIHIGNLRPVIIFDVLHRLLLTLNINVNYVQNITDIDDKIIVKAQQEKSSEKKITSHYTKSYLANLMRYNILFPTCFPRVSNYISSIQKFIKNLLTKNAAYQQAEEILFNIAGQPNYGELSGQNLAKLRGDARKITSTAKRDKKDFEIFAGKTIDIHGGGNDLLFPHHENERIQYLAHNHQEL